MAKFDSKLRAYLFLTSNPTAAVDEEVTQSSAYVSRDSGTHIPPPPQVYKWQLPGFFDGVEDDEVDTTLSLRPPGSNNAKKSPEPQISTAADFSPLPAHTLRFNGLEEDEVDTTLSLRPPATTNNKSTKSPEKASRPEEAAETSTRNVPPPPVVINAMPLRWVEINATPLRWVLPAAPSNKKLRKRSGDESRRVNKRRRNEEDERPLIPSQGLLRAIELRSGSAPEFLYRKTLEECDVSRHHNRLMMTGSEKVIGFLREEEAAAVSGRGLRIVGVDDKGNVYEKLVMKKWASLNIIVINSSDWKEVVAKNNAERGDVVEIWGYRSRENDNPCLAFSLRREETVNPHASTSNNAAA